MKLLPYLTLALSTSVFAKETPKSEPSSALPSFAHPTRLDIPQVKELEGPEFVDFDGDGKIDIISGIYEGHVLFRKNTGTNKKPTYANPIKLQSGGKTLKLTHW